MKQFRFAVYTDVTRIAKKHFPNWFDIYDRVLICPDTNDVWVARIQTGIDAEYESNPDVTLLERNCISYDELGLTCRQLVHADPGMFNRLAVRILQADVDDGGNWDNQEVADVEAAMDLLDGGYGIITYGDIIED